MTALYKSHLKKSIVLEEPASCWIWKYQLALMLASNYNTTLWHHSVNKDWLSYPHCYLDHHLTLALILSFKWQLNGIIFYYRVSSGTSDKSWLKESCDFIAVFSVGLLEGPESSIYFLTKARALVNAANITHACNTFQHYMIWYLCSNFTWHICESLTFIRTSHDICFLIVYSAKAFLWEKCHPSELHN